MSKLFKDDGTEDVYRGRSSKKAKRVCPERLWGKAQIRMDALIEVTSLHELRKFPGFGLKELTQDRTGQHRILLDDRYRICFVWTDKGARSIEITNYHRG